MSALSDGLRRNVSRGCCVEQCKKEGCSVQIPMHFSSYTLVDFDGPHSPVDQNQRRCDYLFAGESIRGDIVAIIELKEGQAKASDVTKQLRAGAQHSEQLVPRGHDFRFVPVLAHGRPLRIQERREFSKASRRIKLRNRVEIIRVIKCGNNLPFR